MLAPIPQTSPPHPNLQNMVYPLQPLRLPPPNNHNYDIVDDPDFIRPPQLLQRPHPRTRHRRLFGGGGDESVASPDQTANSIHSGIIKE